MSADYAFGLLGGAGRSPQRLIQASPGAPGRDAERPRHRVVAIVPRNLAMEWIMRPLLNPEPALRKSQESV